MAIFMLGRSANPHKLRTYRLGYARRSEDLVMPAPLCGLVMCLIYMEMTPVSSDSKSSSSSSSSSNSSSSSSSSSSSNSSSSSSSNSSGHGLCVSSAPRFYSSKLAQPPLPNPAQPGPVLVQNCLHP
ncbi:hypothetical protein PoB_006543800 [Plakobranchus ocellatus]|uniref:Uncharacterized protein n=1 Tax=Plakobranchus ocellatus TaxID=259542 RepID=A0AAV4D4I9_9GAST|nr:hypothetical protein PoB_006543800 [Plakobranchus ocellatus]